MRKVAVKVVSDASFVMELASGRSLARHVRLNSNGLSTSPATGDQRGLSLEETSCESLRNFTKTILSSAFVYILQGGSAAESYHSQRQKEHDESGQQDR